MSEGAAKTASKAHGATIERRPQRHVAQEPAATPSLDAVHALHRQAGNRALSHLLGGGAPLAPGLRADMETRFGTDFSDVRIHNDARAHASAETLNAKAYTHGRDIVFSANRYAPNSLQGRRLLAHELAHVVQQRRGGATPKLDPNAAHEHSAARAADSIGSTAGPIAVTGATGVGVAREEDDSLIGQMRRVAGSVAERVPPEYRDTLSKAADVMADAAVTTALLPIAPPVVTNGIGSTLLHCAEAVATGEGSVTEEIKGFGRDKAQENLGFVKGVATQVTEVADTALWVGGEYNKLRDDAAEAIGGEKGSVGNTVVRHVIDATVFFGMPGVGAAIVQTGQANEAAKSVGLVDEETGQASLTAPMAEKFNEGADWIEEQTGGTSSDPLLFTPLEKGELQGAIASQVALSFVGAEEAKVAIAAVGALGALRGVVETIRADPQGYYKQPAFWSSLLTGALSIVGMAKLRAGNKIVEIAIKSGTVLSVVPHLWQLYKDYNDPQLAQGDPEERRKVLVQDWQNLTRALVDVILAVAHAGAEGKSPAKRKTGAGEGPGKSPVSDPLSGAKDQPAAKGPQGSANEAHPDQASARARKRANARADDAEAAAAKKKKTAERREDKAQRAADRAKKVLAKAEEQRQTAKRRAEQNEQKQAHAEAKKDSSTKAREKAQLQAERAKKRMESAQSRADKAEANADAARLRAEAAKKAAAAARAKADQAQQKAATARAKADALKPPIDPQSVFDPNKPAFAPTPDDAAAPTNKSGGKTPEPQAGPQQSRTPLDIPREGVEMPWRGKGEGVASSEQGYLRDQEYFWHEYGKQWGQHLSPENRSLIAAGRAPIVDDTWLHLHPEHAAYRGETLEHHHLGQGSRAVALPETLHDAYTVFHPQRQVVGEGAEPLRPIKPAKPGRAEKETQRHIREGRVEGPEIDPAKPPPVHHIPRSSALAGVPENELRPVDPRTEKVLKTPRKTQRPAPVRVPLLRHPVPPPRKKTDQNEQGGQP